MIRKITEIVVKNKMHYIKIGKDLMREILMKLVYCLRMEEKPLQVIYNLESMILIGCSSYKKFRLTSKNTEHNKNLSLRKRSSSQNKLK